MPRPPGSKPTVALVYHGAYYRSSGKCADFFQAAYNHKTMIVDPLKRERSVNVITAFHTYSSGCHKRDNALIDFLQPVAHEVEECCRPRIVDSYIRSLELLQASRVTVDWIVLTRFEIMFISPLTQLNLNWGRINFGFRDSWNYWNSMHIVTDLFYLFPISRMNDMISALDMSGTVDHSWAGSGHFTWSIIDERFGGGAWHFISDIHSTSALDGWLCNPHNWVPFYILRNCPDTACTDTPSIGRCTSDAADGPKWGGDYTDAGLSRTNGLDLDPPPAF